MALNRLFYWYTLQTLYSKSLTELKVTRVREMGRKVTECELLTRVAAGQREQSEREVAIWSTILSMTSDSDAGLGVHEKSSKRRPHVLFRPSELPAIVSDMD